MITLLNGQPSVEVKDHELYARNWRFVELQEILGESTCEAIYNSVLEDFWRLFAPEIAKEFGYGEVYSEGRSSGWLTVSDAPDLSACDPCYGTEGKCADCERWEDFEKRIDELVNSCRADFYDRLEETVQERAAEATEAAEMAARGVMTV